MDVSLYIPIRGWPRRTDQDFVRAWEWSEVHRKDCQADNTEDTERREALRLIHKTPEPVWKSILN